jgi:oligopeptide/dipeptide ABC transporter ATP-binding protein
LNLLLDIRSRHNLSFLFIAHDLKVACYFCDRIGVMYRGELMEEAPAADLFKTARHPYTRLLFSSVSTTLDGENGAGASREVSSTAFLKGEVKTPVTELSGCAFAERCPLADEQCRREHPEIQDAVGVSGQPHKVRCFKS